MREKKFKNQESKQLNKAVVTTLNGITFKLQKSK